MLAAVNSFRELAGCAGVIPIPRANLSQRSQNAKLALASSLPANIDLVRGYLAEIVRYEWIGGQVEKYTFDMVSCILPFDSQYISLFIASLLKQSGNVKVMSRVLAAVLDAIAKSTFGVDEQVLVKCLDSDLVPRSLVVKSFKSCSDSVVSALSPLVSDLTDNEEISVSVLKLLSQLPNQEIYDKCAGSVNIVPCATLSACAEYMVAMQENVQQTLKILEHALITSEECDCAVLSACYVKCLKSKSDYSDELMHLTNLCCSLAKSSPVSYSNSICLLGEACADYHGEIISQTVIPLLIQILHANHCSLVSDTVIEVLGHLAPCVDYDGFMEVVESFSLVSKKSVRKTLAMQMYIAHRLDRAEHEKMLTGYLKLLLLLFIDKSALVYQSGNNQELELIWLLQVIATVHSNLNAFNAPVPNELLRLYRSLWSYAVLLGVDGNNCWKIDWRDTMTKISVITPYLLRKNASSYIEMEIQADALIPSSGLDTESSRLRLMLFSILGKHQKRVDEMDVVPVLFLLAIYHCEVLLQNNLGLRNIYNYASDMHRSSLGSVIFTLADKIVDRMISSDWGQFQYRHMAIEQVKQLMLLYPRDALTSMTLRHLELLMARVPYVLFDTGLLDLALEIMQVLFVAYNHETLNVVNYTYPIIVTDKITSDVDICRGLSYRRKLLAGFQKFVEHWLQSASEMSSGEMVASIQTFFGKFRQLSSQFPVHFGYQTALEFATSKKAAQDLKGVSANLTLYNMSYVTNAARFMDLFGQQSFHRGGVDMLSTYLDSEEELCRLSKDGLNTLIEDASLKLPILEHRFYQVFYRAASVLISLKKLDFDLLHLLVWSPIQIFTTSSLRAGIDAWTWLLAQRPQCELQFLNECVDVWEWTIRRNRGIFSQKYNTANSLSRKVEYGPSGRAREMEHSYQYFLPHLLWIDFLSNHYAMFSKCSEEHMKIYFRMVQSTLYKRGQSSSHPLARLCYFKLWVFSDGLLSDLKSDCWVRDVSVKLRMYSLLHSMLALPSSWNGLDLKFVASDILVLSKIHSIITSDLPKNTFIDLDLYLPSSDRQVYGKRVSEIREMQELALVAIEIEVHRLVVWQNPYDDPKKRVTANDSQFRDRKTISQQKAVELVKRFWLVSPRLSIQFASKLGYKSVFKEVCRLVHQFAFMCSGFPEAVVYLVNESSVGDNAPGLKYLPFWSPVTPITAISFFLPVFYNHPCVLQYALRSLDHYDPITVFFYVPQVVQALRHDMKRYVEQFILLTAKSSQIFAHQIIWNAKANMVHKYIDDSNMTVDRLVPRLENIRDQIVNALSGADKDFYEREFNFFERVTGISGLLKPFIKRSKQEKKAKIDEELRLIQVDPGVYLPSNPESIVVDIDYKSGRPLQSHAKAPFMARFKIKKAKAHDGKRPDIEQRQTSYESLYLQDDQNDDVNTADEDDEEQFQMQYQMFKVGDDCRQDVLALQLIAIFKSIFTSAGLDLYLFPYRIVATAPGCGVIEVLPNSVSRDEMGRSNVNDLAKWFTAKFGHKNSVEYQQARDAFIRSLAAYSVILYLLQIKDRHNGNMMVDSHGHIIHIDFGFIFDIVPGGVQFELSPFKLTKEMIDIMGADKMGNNDKNSEHYRRFVELCVRAFLVCRPYADQIVQMVQLMLDSGLPCFKPRTIENLRGRFRLELSDKEAAEYMAGLVNSSHRAWSTYIYDGYQKLTNGIPF